MQTSQVLALKSLEVAWHTSAAGKQICYLGEHPAVCLIENLANLRRDGALYPDMFQLSKISSSDAVSSVDLTPEQIAQIDPQSPTTTQKIGDSWLLERSSALLKVPSIPSPESWNYLLNPLHPQSPALTIEWARKITYDQRLFRLD